MKGYLALKVDLEKAYNRTSWAFLQDTLLEVGLPPLIHTIMACVSPVSMQVVWNGEITSNFLPSRDLRQEDPLSPYLFFLCMERLAHEINDAVEKGL